MLLPLFPPSSSCVPFLFSVVIGRTPTHYLLFLLSPLPPTFAFPVFFRRTTDLSWFGPTPFIFPPFPFPFFLRISGFARGSIQGLNLFLTNSLNGSVLALFLYCGNHRRDRRLQQNLFSLFSPDFFSIGNGCAPQTFSSPLKFYPSRFLVVVPFPFCPNPPTLGIKVLILSPSAVGPGNVPPFTRRYYPGFSTQPFHFSFHWRRGLVFFPRVHGRGICFLLARTTFSFVWSLS